MIVNIHELSSIHPDDFTDEQKKEMAELLESWAVTFAEAEKTAEQDLKHIYQIVNNSIQMDKEYQEKNKIKE